MPISIILIVATLISLWQVIMRIAIKRAILTWCNSTIYKGCVSKSYIHDAGVSTSSKPLHKPVMVKEVLENLYPTDGDTILDLTFGAGGHSEAVLKRCETCRIIALDRDPLAYALAQKISQQYSGRVLPLLGRFSELEDLLRKNGISAINGAIIDAGCSSMQMDTASRGFAISKDGPLDMRMDGDRDDRMPTAADVVNNLDAKDLKEILEKYGEEKHAEKIAQNIVHHRTIVGPIITTKQLAQTVASAFEKSRGGQRRDALNRRAHVATKCFMAIRIFVNDELNELNAGLHTVEKYMVKGGRIVAITFHSLEDRIVKGILLNQHLTKQPSLKRSNMNMKKEDEKKWLVLKKKVIAPQFDEICDNTRARSAKFRSATRV